MDRGLQQVVNNQLPQVNMIDIQFEDINFIIKLGRKDRKSILKNVSGKFRSGELTAIMGPSGAGKSSLLNILTGFQKTGVQGRISSSCCRSSETPAIGCDAYRKESCYILQDDRLNPLFTVQEIMLIATELKIGQSVGAKLKGLLINSILDTFGLSTSSNTKCGNLSGGEKKRLSIALELIDNPPIMFLDEPTTGLDSLSALLCMRMLKTLAATGRTIICTVHQPSASIYELFDHVYVMADGQCIYQGDSSNTVPFLEKVNLPCPEYHNPADHLIEVASGDYMVTLIQEAQEPCWRSNKYSDSTDNDKNSTTLDNDMSENNMLQDDDKIIQKSKVLFKPPSEFYKFQILLRKSYLQMSRDWTVTYLKLVLHIVAAVSTGLLYFNFGNNGHVSMANVAFLLVSMMYLSYTSMMPAVLKFPLEISVLKKERFNNWYKLRTYYAAYIVSSIPIQILFTLTYSIITYLLTGQIMQLDRCCKFMAILTACALTAEGIGIFFGTIANPVNGTFLSCVLFALFVALSGFFMPFSEMSPVWYAASYISYIAYGVSALLQAMYAGDRPKLDCPSQYDYCHYTRPAILLKDLGVDPTGAGYWNELAVLVGLCIALKVLGFVTLKRRLNRAQ